MRIYKTWVAFQGEPMTTSLLCDTIEHEGKKWLVPEWIDRKELGMTRPRRAICLDGFLKYISHSFQGGDYMLLEPLPRNVYEGHAQLELGGLAAVIELPEWDFLLPSARN